MIIQSLDLRDHQSPILFLGKTLNNSGDFPFLRRELCDSSVTPGRERQTLNLYSPKDQLVWKFILNLQIGKKNVLGLLLGNNTNMELIVR